MKILITGGAGYLGSVNTRNLLKNHEVIVYDNLMYNQTSLVDLSNNSNFTFHYGDVREWSKLKYIVEQVDVIIPLAEKYAFRFINFFANSFEPVKQCIRILILLFLY